MVGVEVLSQSVVKICLEFVIDIGMDSLVGCGR